MGGVSELVRRVAGTQPNRTALVDGTTRLTWAQLDDAITRAALAFGAAGLLPGDRVAIQLGTSTDFATLYLGALRAGLVVVPVNPGYTVPELSSVLEDCGARLLVTSSVSAIEAVASLPVEHVAAAAPSAPEPAGTLADLLAGAPQGGDPRADRSGERPGDAALHQRHQRPAQGRDAVGAGGAREPRPAGGGRTAVDHRAGRRCSSRCRCSTCSA